LDAYEHIKTISNHIINALKYIQLHSNTRLDGLG
jgi:hypothetical protein